MLTKQSTNEEKLAALHSERRDLLAQVKRNVHRAGSDGCYRRIDQIDKQILKLNQRQVRNLLTKLGVRNEE